MIYRFLSTQPPLKPYSEFNDKIFWNFLRFGGAWFYGCSNMNGLTAPNIKNKKARFYFTEAGFHKFAKEIIADAKLFKVPLKVISRKNPKKSQIVYQDKWQVAILPKKDKK